MGIYSLGVPRTEQSKTGHSCNLQFFADLQSKRSFLIWFLVINHKGIFSEPCIHKSIDVDGIESIIFDLSTFVILFEMNFKHITGMLGLLHLQILSQIYVEFGKQAIGNDRLYLLTKIRDVDFLTSCTESKLFFDQLIWTFTKDFLDFIVIIKFDCHSQSNSILFQFES